ncbi:hypothetical protein BCR41DRAFT_354998 [Lobosporangium transversale]|uniref:Uncharacterized protein n=1 Tax=Lobosporangium transversale TaxID=64571 RepID=A0A1Y2GKD4_9FUNG|nr:hypothetical protein BCR41DRAFT_354998 [Lobosporangium transversale]ORZ13787.1 hypothetical protein BCR41DRAFT_354998 [Lobosporangium transversale]|eukprot:XP_021880571.1 hypothetical protein BCR41DRAFT_354998 [Lobosporangium transversale]
MRGRLPEAFPTPSLLQELTAINIHTNPSKHSADEFDGIYEEQVLLQTLVREITDEAHSCLSASGIKIRPYILNQREHIALLGIAHLVQQDMRALQYELSRAGRPPDQRDGEYKPAPDWDEDYLNKLLADWNEPVVLEADYYLLRSMCLYDLGTSIQVKVLGPDRVEKYMNMALKLAKKGSNILQSVLAEADKSMDEYWRYPTIISYIHQYQTTMTISEIRKFETVVKLPASEQLLEKARQQATLALQSFYLGIRRYPSISNSSNESFRDQEWSNMAKTAELYIPLANDFLERQIWTQHVVKLLSGAILEKKTRRDDLLIRISKIYLDFALSIHELPEKSLVYPRVSPMFHEMQRAALSALVYAKHAMENARLEDLQPEHYSQVGAFVF